MAEKIELINKNELHNGEMKEVTIGGRHFLVARVADRHYVTDGRCTHMGGVLVQGKLEGTIITCQLHGSRFDLSDGKVVLWTNWTGLLLKIGEALKSPRPLNVYNAMTEGDKIYVIA